MSRNSRRSSQRPPHPEPALSNCAENVLVDLSHAGYWQNLPTIVEVGVVWSTSECDAALSKLVTAKLVETQNVQGTPTALQAWRITNEGRQWLLSKREWHAGRER